MQTAFFYLDEFEDMAKLFAGGYFATPPFMNDGVEDNAGYMVSGSAVCRDQGHDIRDCSSGGPESGNMDHECVRCGQYFPVPLY